MAKVTEKDTRTLYIRGVDELTWRLIHVAAGAQGMDVKAWTLETLGARARKDLGDEIVENVTKQVRSG